MPIQEHQRGEFLIGTDQSRLEIDAVTSMPSTPSSAVVSGPREFPVRGLRRWCQSTREAHGLDRKFGFELAAYPEGRMEILDFDIDKRGDPGKPTS
jgi:hypothetical protein